jgi:ssDNA-binding Zn-finger/Zn-ribbon topoisomerase 1
MLEAGKAKKCGKCKHIRPISDFPNQSLNCLQCKSKGSVEYKRKENATQSFPEFATKKSGEISKCPECGGEMRIRIRRKDQRRFWGCSKFPFCRGTRKI